jgi:hypothetical protein
MSPSKSGDSALSPALEEMPRVADGGSRRCASRRRDLTP